MGFLDKAKKLAEQAQTKLDEVQQQINQQGSPAPPPAGGPVTHYDQHGRPVAPAETATPPHGDPLREEHEPPSAPAPVTETPGVPPTDPSPPAEGQAVPPAVPGAPPTGEDRNHPSYAPPKLTSGDPLAG